MKLGVFDSGLGGLLITKAIRGALPDIDMVYFGDTLHVPYGNRSKQAVYDFTVQALEFLFAQDCKLVIVACNTASAAALRDIQQKWLSEHYPDRRVLGVVVPVLEEAAAKKYKTIGLMATRYVVESGLFEEELGKIDPDISIVPIASPLLVPMIENDGWDLIDLVLEKYFKDIETDALDCLILGCTHYPLVRSRFEAFLPGLDLLAQDWIIPPKLLDYLARHPEIDDMIGRNGLSQFFVSDLTPAYSRAAQLIYGMDLHLETMKKEDL